MRITNKLELYVKDATILIYIGIERKMVLKGSTIKIYNQLTTGEE